MSNSEYPLKAFREDNPQKLFAVIEAYPLATLISPGQEWPVITQIPLYLEDQRLWGHFDANNPHVSTLESNPLVTCLFHGPNHYITPSIYPDTHYPGWNYVTVKVQAKAQPVEELTRVQEILFETALRNEPRDSGYKLTADQKNFHLFSQQIRAFEFELLKAEGLFKLAQDKGSGHAELARQHLSGLVSPEPDGLLKRLLAD